MLLPPSVQVVELSPCCCHQYKGDGTNVGTTNLQQCSDLLYCLLW